MIEKENSQRAEISQPNNDVWIRFDWIWKLIFYITLLLSVIFTWLDQDNSPADKQTALILSGITVVWHFLGTIGLPKRFPKLERHPGLMSLVVVGVLILWFILVGIDRAFLFMLAGLFSMIFSLLPTQLAIPGSIVVTAMFAYIQITADGSPFSIDGPLFFIYGLFAALAILMALWMRAIIGQSIQRRDLIKELEQSQSELAAAERRAGVLAERQRLAHEIHDTLAQGFTSIIMHLEAADQALPSDNETVATHLDFARTMARDSLKQARRVVDNLRPASLEGHTLPEAIERTAVRWSEQTGVGVQTTSTGEPLLLHPDVEVTLLRATQEGLNNIRKHASASQVDITLSYMGSVVILDVQDNGIGMNEERNRKTADTDGGFGLIAMRQRVAQFNGSVSLESDPGEGTTLVVEIPVGDG